MRRWRAAWRDSLLLLCQFRLPLLLFVLLLLGGGLLYHGLARLAGEPTPSLPAAIYLILGLTFLQPLGDFPRAWYLEIFYFLMPVLGIGIFAQGVADFGVSFFNRSTRARSWEAAVASTFNQHIVLIGLGHLGYHVALNLQRMGQDIVVIELNPAADLVASVRELGIPVLHDDGVREVALLDAGIRQARAIILCTQNDALNLQIAVKARSFNPTVQVTVRIFDEDFAQALQAQFGFTALSATSMAAPTFAAAAAGVDMTRPITVEGQALCLARLVIPAGAPLAGMTVAALESRFEVSVVLLKHQGDPDLHPVGARLLATGDTLAVLGGPHELSQLALANEGR